MAAMPVARGLQRGQAEVVAHQREWRFPGDALDGGLGEISLAAGAGGLALEVGQHLLLRLAALEDALEETERPGALRERRRAAEGEAHAGGAQLVGCLGEAAQQPLAGLRRQAIGDADKISVLAAGDFERWSRWRQPGRERPCASRRPRPAAGN